MHDRPGVRAIRWPAPGRTELVELEPAPPEANTVAVSISVSVTSPGTERARYLGLPTAGVAFPHAPGSLAAGIAGGDRVAVRNAPHQSEVCVAPAALHPVPPGAALIDAALWQLALTAMHGLAVGGHRKGEPIAVLGAGLLGAVTRRVAAARGSECLAVAASEARRWTIRAEPATGFALADHPPPERYRLVLDVTGTAGGLAAATRFAADGGHVVLLGSPRAAAAPLPAREMQERGLSVHGAHVRTLDDVRPHTAEFFALLEQGRFGCRDLLPRYAPEQAPEVYRRLVGDRAFVGAAFAWGATRRKAAARTPGGRVAGRAAGRGRRRPAVTATGRWIPVTATGAPEIVLDAAVPPGVVAIVDGGDRPAAYGWLAHPDDAASELAAAASAVAERAAVHAAVTVLGTGALAELVRLALPPATAGPADAVVVARGDLIADAVERVRDRGTVLLAAPAPDPLVRTYADVHRRGLTVAGVPWRPAPDPPRRLVDWAAAHAVTARGGRPTTAGAWYRLEPS